MISRENLHRLGLFIALYLSFVYRTNPADVGRSVSASISNKTDNTHLNATVLSNSTSGTDFTIFMNISLVECVVGIAANGLLLLVIIHNPSQNLRRSSWITIANLSLADLVTSVTTIPFCFNSPEVFRGSHSALRWGNFSLHVGYCASFLILLLFTIEQYIAVKYPMEASNILTRKRIGLACLASWITAIVLATACLQYTQPFGQLAKLAVYGVLEIAVVIMLILKVLLMKQIRASNRNAPMQGRQTQMKNIATTLLLLILILLATALPYFIGKQIQMASSLINQYYHQKYSRSSMRFYFPYFYFPVACLNFIVNPFVYAWRLPDYRRAFVSLFRIGLSPARLQRNKSTRSTELDKLDTERITRV